MKEQSIGHKEDQRPHTQNTLAADPMFQKCRAAYQNFCMAGSSEIDRFKRLKAKDKKLHIAAFQLWIIEGGPQNQIERNRCRLFLEAYRQIQASEAENQFEMPKIFVAFSDWWDSLGTRSSQKTRGTTQQDGATTSGKKQQSLLSLHQQPASELKETKLLKQQ